MTGMEIAVQPVQPVQESPLDSILGQFGQRKEKELDASSFSSPTTEMAGFHFPQAVVESTKQPMSEVHLPPSLALSTIIPALQGHVVALFGPQWSYYRRQLAARLQDGRGAPGAEFRALVDTRIHFGEFGCQMAGARLGLAIGLPLSAGRGRQLGVVPSHPIHTRRPQA